MKRPLSKFFLVAFAAFGCTTTSEAPPTQEDKGGLTRKEITNVIKRNLNDVLLCYQTELVSKPKIQGKLTVGFVIDKNGDIETIFSDLDKSSIDDEGLRHCVLSTMKQWKFPEPRKQTNVTVSYPFIFTIR